MRAKPKSLLLLVFAALPLLSACGDHEADQAKAFADLLQNRVLENPGVHIPILSDEEREKIGHYAEDFAVLKSFKDDLNAAGEKFGKSLNPVPANMSPLDFPKYRGDLIAARDFFPNVSAEFQSAEAKAEAARGKLHQPDAVKVKYDAAFAQLVTRPTKAFRDLVPLVPPAIESEIQIADFIDAHKADLKSVGGKLATAKPELRKQLEALFAIYLERQAKVQTARRQLELVVEGH